MANPLTCPTTSLLQLDDVKNFSLLQLITHEINFGE